MLHDFLIKGKHYIKTFKLNRGNINNVESIKTQMTPTIIPFYHDSFHNILEQLELETCQLIDHRSWRTYRTTIDLSLVDIHNSYERNHIVSILDKFIQSAYLPVKN